MKEIKKRSFVSETPSLQHTRYHVKLQVFSEDFNFRIVIHLVGGVATAVETNIATLYAFDCERTSLVIFHIFLILAFTELG